MVNRGIFKKNIYYLQVVVLTDIMSESFCLHQPVIEFIRPVIPVWCNCNSCCCQLSLAISSQRPAVLELQQSLPVN